MESVYRRINPDDWDDDGVENDLDAISYSEQTERIASVADYVEKKGFSCSR